MAFAAGVFSGKAWIRLQPRRAQVLGCIVVCMRSPTCQSDMWPNGQAEAEEIRVSEFSGPAEVES